MIASRDELQAVLAQDARANNRATVRPRPFRSGEEIWLFLRLLRRLEYYSSFSGWKRRLWLPWVLWTRLRFKRLSVRLNYTIPLNVCGPGLSLAHVGTIVISNRARVGANCRIHEGVTIGATNGSGLAPRIGNNVFLGAGAKVIGDIEIADDVCVGANAVVVKSVTEPGITVGGVPARKISGRNSHANLAPGLGLK